MVERVCGVPQDLFLQVCELFVQNSGRERTTAFVHGVGWTQHTIGSQYIRAASILQLLLGNVGRPGGGVMAMRGHASIQGSSDIPTLFDTLPGYIPMPHAHVHEDLDSFIEGDAPDKGFWGNMRDYTVSLLKAWWGDAATAENDFCFDYLPRLTGSHSTYDTVMAQIAGSVKGYFLFGQNPAVGSANARMQRLGMSKLDWLVVRDFSLIESATWWKDGPEIETGEMRTEDIATEVFFLPAAAHTEKDGTFTNTQRMLQWHAKAVEPQDDQRSDLWFMYHLGRRLRERLAASADERDRPLLDLTWSYPTEGAHDDPSADAVLREINGRNADGRAARRVHRARGRRVDGVRLLDLLRLLRRRRQPDGAAQAAQRAELDRRRVGVGLAGEPAHPLQPRLLPTPRAGPGASARRSSGGTPSRGSGRATTCPTSRSTRTRPTARRRARTGQTRSRATSRSSCRPTAAAGCTRRPASRRGRCRRTTSRRTRRSRTSCTATSAIRRARSTGTRATATTRIPARRAPTSSRSCSRPTA